MMGQGDKFDRAIAEFSVAYANQTEHDHARLLDDATGEPLDDVVFHKMVKRIVSTAIEQRIRDQ